MKQKVECPECHGPFKVWLDIDASLLFNVSSRTVRRWTLGEKPINYASWCVLCVQAGLGQIWMFSPLQA